MKEMKGFISKIYFFYIQDRNNKVLRNERSKYRKTHISVIKIKLVLFIILSILLEFFKTPSRKTHPWPFSLWTEKLCSRNLYKILFVTFVVFRWYYVNFNNQIKTLLEDIVYFQISFHWIINPIHIQHNSSNSNIFRHAKKNPSSAKQRYLHVAPCYQAFIVWYTRSLAN